MSENEFRSKSFSINRGIKYWRRTNSLGLVLSRRTVLRYGVAGIGATLLRPSFAGTGKLHVYLDTNLFRIDDGGGHSWELKTEWFGENCILKYKRDHDAVFVRVTNGHIPATNLALDLSFRIYGSNTNNPRFEIRSSKLGFNHNICLKKWLKGEKNFSGCGKMIRFLSAANLTTSVLGKVNSLSRDWEILLDDGHVTSKGIFRAKVTALQLQQKSRYRSEVGILVKSNDGIELSGFFERTLFLNTSFNFKAEVQALPDVYFAPSRIEMELDSRTNDAVTLAVAMGESVELGVSIPRFEAVLILSGNHIKFEVSGLVDSYGTVLQYHKAAYNLISAFPNSVFTLAAYSDRKPDFGHWFRVLSSALPVEGLITGFCKPSTAHDIWISSDNGLPKPKIERMFAGQEVFSKSSEIATLVSEHVCTGCSVLGKPEGITYFSTRIHQTESLLDLGMEFYNFDLASGGKIDTLVPRIVPGPCLVIVHFSPQHIEEDAFNEGAGCQGETPGPDTIPIRSKVASPTRIVFEYPKFLGALELKSEKILEWNTWLPRSSGLTRHPKLIEKPKWDESSIEAPRGLILQHGSGTRWRVNGHNGAVDSRHVLSNVDLVPNEPFDPDEADFQRRPRMVAVWSEAFIECGVLPPQPKEGMWRTLCRRINLGGGQAKNECEVLDPNSTKTTIEKGESGALTVIDESTLRAVVRLSHDNTLCAEPFKAEHMILTQLGAWTALDGNWPKTPARGRYTDLKSKKHRITNARTQFDQDGRRGFLYPFGHRLTLVPETNRRKHTNGEAFFSVLKKKWYVVVEQPNVVASEPRLLEGEQDQRFRMPFQSVRILEGRTPNLDPPDIKFIIQGNNCNTFFWGTVCGQQFFFNVVGTDWLGRDINFKVPLLFVNDVALTASQPQSISELNTKLEEIYLDADRHINSGSLSRSFVNLSGQTVALQTGYQEGDTDFEISHLRFEGVAQLPPSTDELGDCDVLADSATENTSYFYPAVEVAEARSSMLGRATANGGGTCWLAISNPLLDPSNFEVIAVKHTAATDSDSDIAKLNSGIYPDFSFKLPFDQNSDSAGGVSSPTPKIDAWSRLKGPIGIGESARKSLVGDSVPADSVAEFRSGSLDPSSYFDLNAKICGVIPLSEIVGSLGLDSTTPALLNFFNNGGDIADSTGYVYDWETTLSPWDSGILKFGPLSTGIDAKLIITGGVLVELLDDPKLTGFISGEITNFFVSLQAAGNGIRADFSRIGLNARLGEKVDFDVNIVSVTFIGPLMEFIQKLKELLGFGDGFDVVLNSTSVTAQLGPLELPSFGFGVFSMSQISFFASCDIYFKGNKPILFTFKFSTRDRPFTLAVALLGGRGSFLIAIDTSGVQEIAASLEFGAVAEFAFGGFAHGNLYIMGGVFYSSKRIVVSKRRQPDPSKPNDTPGQEVRISETIITVVIYVRAGGSLSCFGFISISLDVHLGLNIVQRGGSSVAYGTATLTFSVKIGFFKKSFSVTFSKELPGSQSQGGNQRVITNPERNRILAFQNSLSPASPFTPCCSYRTDDSGFEASPAQIESGVIYAETCDHQGETCGPNGIGSMSKAQFRYYWYSFGENRRMKY